MKKGITIIAILLFTIIAKAALIQNQPVVLTDANGEKVELLASGDEFYNYLHDKDGYTVVQGSDGLFYYGVSQNGKVIPSTCRYDKNSQKRVQLAINARISPDEYQKRKDSFAPNNRNEISYAPSEGNFNNICIFIKFSDSEEFATTRGEFEEFYNSLSGSKSVRGYYKEVSYNKLDLQTHFFPLSTSETNLSYTDDKPTAYYRPYNEITNPEGYNTDTEKRLREHTLLKKAIESVSKDIQPSLNVDSDNDGRVDCVTFIIRADQDGWSSLLWAHMWQLFSYSVKINGKTVDSYTFQPEKQATMRTIGHELFHAIGAPDLYHYNSDGFWTVGSWDLMEYGSGHMGAYMKWKYAKKRWIVEIPTINVAGRYRVMPLTSPVNNAFRINSLTDANQYYVVEARQKSGLFEETLPGAGLLVYKIDSRYNGNASSTGTSKDEVYIYRPDGTATKSGDVQKAYYPLDDKNSITPSTNPKPWTKDDPNGTLQITNIVINSDGSVSFDLNGGGPEIVFPELTTQIASAISSSSVQLNGSINAKGNDLSLSFEYGESYTLGSEIKVSTDNIDLNNMSNVNVVLDSLKPATIYYYRFKAKLSNGVLATGALKSFRTLNETNISGDENIFKSDLLYQNYPNPFNPTTKISFYLDDAKIVDLAIFNQKGELVDRLVNRQLNRGLHSIDFNGAHLNSGIYFCQLTTDKKRVVSKMILVK